MFSPGRRKSIYMPRKHCYHCPAEHLCQRGDLFGAERAPCVAKPDTIMFCKFSISLYVL